jgi:hypothetical protein
MAGQNAERKTADMEQVGFWQLAVGQEKLKGCKVER